MELGVSFGRESGEQLRAAEENLANTWGTFEDWQTWQVLRRAAFVRESGEHFYGCGEYLGSVWGVFGEYLHRGEDLQNLASIAARTAFESILGQVVGSIWEAFAQAAFERGDWQVGKYCSRGSMLERTWGAFGAVGIWTQAAFVELLEALKHLEMIEGFVATIDSRYPE